MRKPNDLFESTSEKYHPFYQRLRKSAVHRQHINTLWQWYVEQKLDDDNFISDFPIQTYQRWWELETAWFLYNCGFNISKTGAAGSDFICENKDITFEVEAIVATSGKEDTPDFVPEHSKEGSSITERERIELLRLTNAIETKAKKHLCDIRKRRSNPKLPFIIALSPIAMPPMIADWDMPAALKAVYPIGKMFYEINPTTGKLKNKQWECRPEVKKTDSQNPPPSTQIFCPGYGSGKHHAVSGLLYSTLNVWTCGYPYTPYEHQKQFAIIHNFDSIKPLAKGSIKAGSEYWIERTEIINEYKVNEFKIEE